MTKLDARTLDFFDRNVINLIVEKYGLTEKKAISDFINSKTYKMLADKETGIYYFSPYVVLELWESEKITGEPQNSQYIRNET